ncbi:MAG: hypothetical protein WBW76_07330 [Candidatus Cybelea sp.]
MRDSKGYELIYSFPSGAGGSDPLNSLTFVDGVAYGTTYAGGDVSGCNCGAVFACMTIIYTFKGVASQDGDGPRGDLLLVGKKLYGITGSGGQNGGVCASNPVGAGCGTVFAIDTSGNEQIVYRFKGGKDGEAPVAGLVYRDGVLYGVTAWGGVSTTCTSGAPSGIRPAVHPLRRLRATSTSRSAWWQRRNSLLTGKRGPVGVLAAQRPAPTLLLR